MESAILYIHDTKWKEEGMVVERKKSFAFDRNGNPKSICQLQ